MVNPLLLLSTFFSQLQPSVTMYSRSQRHVSRIELTNLTPIPFRLSLELVSAATTPHNNKLTPKTFLIISPIPFKLSFNPLKDKPFSSDNRAASPAADFPPLLLRGSEKARTIDIPLNEGALEGAPRLNLPSKKRLVATDLPSPAPSPTTNVGHGMRLKGSETSVRSAMKPTGVTKSTSTSRRSRKRRNGRIPKRKKEASTPQKNGGINQAVGSAVSGATSETSSDLYNRKMVTELAYRELLTLIPDDCPTENK